MVEGRGSGGTLMMWQLGRGRELTWGYWGSLQLSKGVLLDSYSPAKHREAVWGPQGRDLLCCKGNSQLLCAWDYTGRTGRGDPKYISSRIRVHGIEGHTWQRGSKDNKSKELCQAVIT